MTDEELDVLLKTSNEVLLEIISEEVDIDVAIINALNTVIKESEVDGM
jgi:hypothetical protein